MADRPALLRSALRTYQARVRQADSQFRDGKITDRKRDAMKRTAKQKFDRERHRIMTGDEKETSGRVDAARPGRDGRIYKGRRPQGR